MKTPTAIKPGLASALEEIRRRNDARELAKQTVDARFGAQCAHKHVYKSRCVKCLRIVLSLMLLALTLGSVRAQGYDLYSGNAALVTTAQIDQARQEQARAAAFRGMSIADRWDQTEAGSLSKRWSDNGAGSIAARWTSYDFGSIAKRWDNK